MTGRKYRIKSKLIPWEGENKTARLEIADDITELDIQEMKIRTEKRAKSEKIVMDCIKMMYSTVETDVAINNTHGLSIPKYPASFPCSIKGTVIKDWICWGFNTAYSSGDASFICSKSSIMTHSSSSKNGIHLSIIPCGFCGDERLNEEEYLEWTHENPVTGRKYRIKSKLIPSSIMTHSSSSKNGIHLSITSKGMF